MLKATSDVKQICKNNIAEDRNLSKSCLGRIHRDTLVDGINIVTKPYEKNACPCALKNSQEDFHSLVSSRLYAIHCKLSNAGWKAGLLALASHWVKIAEGAELAVSSGRRMLYKPQPTLG